MSDKPGDMPSSDRNSTDHPLTCVIVSGLFISLQSEMRTDLEQAGFEVVIINGGNAALDFMRHSQVGLVIAGALIDSKFGGFHLIKRMREEDRLARVPVILLTMKPPMWEEEVARREWCVSVSTTSTVRKIDPPFRKGEFLDLVNQVLSSNEELTGNQSRHNQAV